MDPGSEEAAKQVEAFSKELDRHAFWKAMDEVAGEEALKKLVEFERIEEAFPKFARFLKAAEVVRIATLYRAYLLEADRIRDGR